jgi:hypothetical protein
MEFCGVMGWAWEMLRKLAHTVAVAALLLTCLPRLAAAVVVAVLTLRWRRELHSDTSVEPTCCGCFGQDIVTTTLIVLLLRRGGGN